jgi:hypothetical protein
MTTPTFFSSISIRVVANGYEVQPYYYEPGRMVADVETYIFPTMAALHAWMLERVNRPPDGPDSGGKATMTTISMLGGGTYTLPKISD